MANFGEGDVLVVNGLRYYQGGTVLGDLTITGDLSVQGGGSLAYDEIVTGTLEVTTSIATPQVGSISGALTVTGVTTSGVVVQTGDTNNYVSVSNGILRLGTAGAQRMTIQSGQLSVEQAMPVIFYTGAQTGETSRFTVAAGSTTWAGAAATTLAITVGSGASVIKIGTSANASANGNILVGNGTSWYNEYSTSGILVNGSVNGGIWNLNGTGEMLAVDVATSGATLKDSPRYTMRSRYWDSAASQNYDAYFYHDMTATTPASDLVLNIGGSDRLRVSSTGLVSVGGAGIVLYSDAMTTEQSRFTIAAGSTTWTGAASSHIVISPTFGASAGFNIGGGTTAGNEIRIGISDQDRYDVVATYHNWRVGNIQGMNLTSGLLRLDTLTDLGFYTDSGSTLTGKFVNVATSLTWQGPDTTDSLLVQNGSMVFGMNSVNVITLADTYFTQRKMGGGVATNSHWHCIDIPIVNGQNVVAGDTVQMITGGTCQSAAAGGANLLGYAVVGGLGNVGGTVYCTVLIHGYVATLTADVVGVTFGRPITVGANVANRWQDAVATNVSCAIAWGTATSGNPFPALFVGPFIV